MPPSVDAISTSLNNRETLDWEVFPSYLEISILNPRSSLGNLFKILDFYPKILEGLKEGEIWIVGKILGGRASQFPPKGGGGVIIEGALNPKGGRTQIKGGGGKPPLFFREV